jgi:hypothetical protein
MIFMCIWESLCPARCPLLTYDSEMVSTHGHLHMNLTGHSHTRFQKETRCISYVRQDQVYTHIIDVISEIYQRQCSKSKQDRVNNIITL